ncbi:MAG: ornithine carbamoyltransferase [Halobacteriota archaeon]
MKHLLSISDLTKDEIFEIIDSTTKLKSERYRNVVTDYLTNKSLAMIFELPSTRTRVSFEVAMIDLGGHALCLTKDELQLSRGEPIRDTARTLSRYVHAVMIRARDHKTIEEYASHSTVPVINGLSDREHPCQVLTDLMTILEYKNKLDGVNITWVGDGNNVCNSLILASAIVGMKLTISSPPGYEPNKGVLEKAKEMGIDLNFEIDPQAAVEDADAIYTDVWTSMGKEEEKGKRTGSFSNYQVNKKLVEGAKDDVIVLHCLPAHRGEEITDEVIEGPRSVVFEQAENRLHTQKAILLKLMEREHE